MHLSRSTTLAGAWQNSGGVCKARRPHTQTQMGDWSPWRANVREGGRTEGRAICGMLAQAAFAHSFICYAGMWHDFHGILTEIAKALMRTRICKSVFCLECFLHFTPPPNIVTYVPERCSGELRVMPARPDTGKRNLSET